MADSGVPAPKLTIDSATVLNPLNKWITGGFTCDSKEILKRPSAITNPNTFVVMWKGVTLEGLEKVDYVALDVHYEGLTVEKDKALKALGGLWIKGIEGGLKPEQRPLMKPKLKAVVPAKSPDPTTLKTFGGY
jgi:hypothetical protein